MPAKKRKRAKPRRPKKPRRKKVASLLLTSDATKALRELFRPKRAKK